jgi:hypothetical protein
VHILVIALCLTSFGFAIAAERRRSTVLIPRPFFLHPRIPKQASVRPSQSAHALDREDARISGCGFLGLY